MHQKKFSHEHYPSKQGSFNKDYEKKLDVNSLVQDLTKPKMSEKEFYEKCKQYLDTQTDRFGQLISKIFEIIIQKEHSAYQLFKMLMNSKVKNKLKFITPEDERKFYPLLFDIMKTQKDSVVVEGLKVLGFITSECLLGISQQAQVEIVTKLKPLVKIEVKNLNINRLSLNCIGNILTHSNYKIPDENNELFNSIYELLKELAPLQSLEDNNNVRLLAAILRVMNSLFVDMKSLPANVNEFLISQLIKYLYLGTNFFQLPKSSFYNQNESSDSGFPTSSSDLSDVEESGDKKKHEEVCSKIRNYCASCLSNVFRQNNKIIGQYLPTLLPCKIFSKDITKFIHSAKEPLILQNEPIADKKRTKNMQLMEFKGDFNEPNLLYLLLFEESSKIKLSVCKAISAILDGYHNDKLLLTIDGEKLEKSKIDPYKSISHQIYQVFKNLSLTIVVGILVEHDEGFVNHLLRLAVSMISHLSFEKVGFLTIEPLINTILIKILPKYSHHTIYLSCIACFSALVNGRSKHKSFEALALNQNFDIIRFLLSTIKEALECVGPTKEARSPKHDKLAESTILLESIISLSKFPKHHVEHLLENSESLIYIAEKVQHLDRKYANVTFKLIEEIMRYISSDKGDFEETDVEPNAPKSLSPQPKFKSNSNIKVFHSFLETHFSHILENSSSDFLEYVLNILYYLDEIDWAAYYPETKTKLVGIISKINSSQNLKQALLRMLGKICTFSIFIKQSEFASIVYQTLKSNANEKNNNIMIKNSWVLANLCANFNHFEQFTLQENHDVLSMILNYCSSPKEKLVSNGYRGLGYFVSNNSDETLVKLITSDETKGKELLNSLREVYLKPFSTFSVKVCWNVCVSFSNILKFFKPNFMKVFFSEELLENLKTILTNKNNFKTQIHCVEMLTLAYERFPSSSCFDSLSHTLTKIYFGTDEGQFDVTELRYLPQLKIDINKLLLKVISNRDLQKNPADVIEILINIPHKFLKILYDQLENLYKEYEEKHSNKWEEKKDEDVMKMNVNEKHLDEAPVKGMASRNQITIQPKILKETEADTFREYLLKVQGVCKDLIQIIDSSDEINVPFSVYESMKQLADIEVEKEEPIVIELYHF